MEYRTTAAPFEWHVVNGMCYGKVFPSHVLLLGSLAQDTNTNRKVHVMSDEVVRSGVA